jgi:hypothetical protein
MKNFKLISLLVIILIVSATTFIYSNSAKPPVKPATKPVVKINESIVFVRAYEHGWIKSIRGIYICYGHGKIDKIELEDDLDPITNADRLATTLNKVTGQGYKYFGSYRQSGAGQHSANYYTEYVFKK